MPKYKKAPETANLVAKHAWKTNKPKVFRDKTKYSRKVKGAVKAPFYVPAESILITEFGEAVLQW